MLNTFVISIVVFQGQHTLAAQCMSRAGYIYSGGVEQEASSIYRQGRTEVWKRGNPNLKVTFWLKPTLRDESAAESWELFQASFAFRDGRTFDMPSGFSLGKELYTDWERVGFNRATVQTDEAFVDVVVMGREFFAPGRNPEITRSRPGEDALLEGATRWTVASMSGAAMSPAQVSLSGTRISGLKARAGDFLGNLREFAGAKGLTLQMNEDTATATITGHGKTCRIALGAKSLTAGATQVTMPHVIAAVGSEIYVPTIGLQAISDALSN